MNVTFILFYYLPEKPTLNYLYQPVIDGLISLGHTVNIIAPNPTRGVSEDERINYKVYEEYEEGKLIVHRVKSYTYSVQKYTKFKLLRRYISVAKNLTRKLKQVKSDVVFVATTPPILQSYLVTKYCHKHNIKVVYNVQDIYPDNIFKQRSLAYKFFDHFQKSSLDKASHIITISQTMKDTLLKKGNYENKLSVIYNYDISGVAQAKLLRIAPLFDQNKFNVVYAGNIGYVQDVDVVLAAAKLIANKNIVFHVFGEGSQSKRIKNRIVDEKLSNVFFYDPVDVAQSGHIYNSAQLNIISILPGIIKTALPLKTASILTANVPFVFIGVGEAVNEPFLINNPNFHGIDNRDYYSLAKVIEREYESDKRDHNQVELKLFNKDNNVRAYIDIILNNFTE